jgi:nitroimidazol reductase NimA-like FMN-containing flavoprotein (pyridoxamine 5'-phosphate oxidase superfamily)
MPSAGRIIEVMSELSVQVEVPVPLSPTARSTLRRHRERARQDRTELHAVLDEALICHLGVVTGGAPMVLPTCFGRRDDILYLHGSTGAASIGVGSNGPVCVTVTLLDGLVYARSVMHHSANFRSAVVYGTPRPVTEEPEKLRALEAIVEHTTPGSWEHARQPSRKELAATAVLGLDLTEASLKVRTGPPGDDEDDVVAGLAWAGVLPVRTVFGSPRPCPLLVPESTVPEHVLGHSRG